MPLTIFFLSRHHVRKEFQLSLSKQFKGYPYIRCVFEMKCEFFREHRKRKDGKKLFYKDFSINMSPTLIQFQWRSYSFWSALVKSSLMMVGTTPFNLVSLLYLILPAIYLANPVDPHYPHDVRFPKRSNPFFQLIGNGNDDFFPNFISQPSSQVSLQSG